MTASEIAAWWGAGVATVVLGWDIYKFRRSGARLRVSANANMQFVNWEMRRPDGDRHIVVEAVNNGDQPTTITHLCVMHYKSWFHRLIRRSDKQGAVLVQTGVQLPHVLRPGERWIGTIDQGDIDNQGVAKGLLFCGVIHGARKYPVLARAFPRPRTTL